MFRSKTERKTTEAMGRSLGAKMARLLVGGWTMAWVGLQASAADTQAPSVPTGLVVSELTATGFTLGWAPSTDNVKVTGYEIFKDGCGAGSTTALAKRFTSLTPGSALAVAVRARDGSGNWSALSAALPVKVPADVTPPSIPTGVTAEEITMKSFLLRWTASVDDVKTTGYEIFLDGDSVGATSGRSKRISGLRPAGRYRVTVRARDAADNWSALSEEHRVETLADTEPPTVPTEVCASAISATRFVLKWSPAKDNVKVTAYEIFQDGVSLGTTTANSRAITGAAPGTEYRMTVRAGDEAGNWSPLSAVRLVTTAADKTRPSVPTGLAASHVSAAGLTLTWQPSTDNVGVTAYEIFRDGLSVGTVTAPGMELTGLLANTTYRLRVRARDAAGNWSAQSPVLKVATTASDRTPPSVPSQLVCSAVTSTGFTLSWAAATDDTGVKEYEVFRDGVSLGRTMQTAMTFAGLSPGSNYRMTVRASDAAGNWSEVSDGLLVSINDGAVMSGFEPDEGYVQGSLGGQDGWSVAGEAQVVVTPVHGGRQALSFPAATSVASATRSYHIPAEGIVFFDLYARPFAAATAGTGVFFETDAAEVALVKRDTAGQVQVLDGDGRGGGTWVATDAMLPVDATGATADWMRLTVRTDQMSRRWDLYVDGRLKAVNLGFASDAVGSTGAMSLSGNSGAATGFDEILVGPENPVFADADRDGMDDEWEAARGLSPTINDRDGDRDGDGVSNIEEFLIGTDPAANDSDHDGLPDEQEVSAGTNPLRADSDGDGMSDGWEVAHGLDPRVAADANLDSDGDGRTNGQEYSDGTNPEDFYNGRALQLRNLQGSGGLDYSYDPSGRLILATTPSGRASHFVRDAAGNLASISVTGTSPIETWRKAHGLPPDGTGTAADDAILAGDRLPNLAKYAFGLDPLVAFAGDAPLVTRTSVSGARYLVLTYRRPDPAPADLIYIVEVSPDGVTWSSASGETVMMSAMSASGFANVAVRDATPVGDAPAGRRIRLKIERTLLP